MKRILLLITFLIVAGCQSAEAWNFRVGEDWTQSSKDFSTSGTLASGTQTVTGNSVISGNGTVGGTLTVAGTTFASIDANSKVGRTFNTDYASLAVAISTIGAVDETVLLVCDEEIIVDGTTVTSTANIALDFTCGGTVIGVSGGGTETLVIGGPLILQPGVSPFGADVTVTDNAIAGLMRSANAIATLRLYDHTAEPSQTIWAVKGVGFYYWDETSSAADDGDLVLVPTGSATNGRWLKMEVTTLTGTTITADLVGDVTGGITGDVDGNVTGYSNTQNVTDTRAGYQVLVNDPSIGANTGFGYKALTAMINGGGGNTVVGAGAAEYATTALNNTAVGRYAMRIETDGAYNTAIGSHALYFGTGNNNVAIGYKAAYQVPTGFTTENVAVGAYSLYTDDSNYGVGIGYESLYTTTGDYNTGVGYVALKDLTTGANNTALGNGAGIAGSPSGSLTTESNQIVLGNDSVTHAHIKVAWTVSSDARDKADIKDYTYGLEYISLLNPVTYVWDNRSDYSNGVSDGSLKHDESQLGFLAQDLQVIEDTLGISNSYIVDESNPDKLGFNETKLIPILVNAIQELTARIEVLEAN